MEAEKRAKQQAAEAEKERKRKEAEYERQIRELEKEEQRKAREAERKAAQRSSQVVADLAEHLVGFDYLDRCAGRVEAQRLAQFVDHADVHAGDEAAAQVERHAVRLLVVDGA